MTTDNRLPATDNLPCDNSGQYLDIWGDGRATKTKERKSFFRRLAEKKGSPRIDWEEVLFVHKSEIANF
jgi:hypothetical protein